MLIDIRSSDGITLHTVNARTWDAAGSTCMHYCGAARFVKGVGLGSITPYITLRAGEREGLELRGEAPWPNPLDLLPASVKTLLGVAHCRNILLQPNPWTEARVRAVGQWDCNDREHFKAYLALELAARRWTYPRNSTPVTVDLSTWSTADIEAQPTE